MTYDAGLHRQGLERRIAGLEVDLKQLVKEVKAAIAEFRERHSPEFDPDCENCQPFIRLEKAINGL